MSLRPLPVAAGLLSALLALTAGAAMEPTAAPAEAKKPRSDECVFFRTVYDWQVLDRSNLIIWAPSSRTAYHVELAFPLTDLRSAIRLAFIDHNNDGLLCGYGMDKVAVPDSPMRWSSTILAMTRLDDASLAALAEKYHVKLPKRYAQKDAAAKDEG